MNNHKTAWEKNVDALIDSIGYAVIRISPLVGPLPSIATILKSANFSVYAWLIVIGVELIGYAVGDAAVKAVKLKTIPSRYILWAITGYIATIEGLMLGYDVIPTWVAWIGGEALLADAVRATVSIIFPFFTLAGAGLYAFHGFLYQEQTRQEQEQTETQILAKQAQQEDRAFKLRKRDQLWEDERAKQLRLTEIELAKLTVASPLQLTVAAPLPATTPATAAVASNDAATPEALQLQRRKEVATFYRDNATASYQVVATALRIPNKSTVGRDLAWLKEQGIVDTEVSNGKTLVRVNGKFETFMRG